MLSQPDADALLAMPKRYEGPGLVELPPGSDLRSEMVGIPHPEERFVLDLWRGRRNAAKIKFQTRGRHVFILARLDVNGAPHTNPDGEVIEGSHLHIYREGYGDKWAVGSATISRTTRSATRHTTLGSARACNPYLEVVARLED